MFISSLFIIIIFKILMYKLCTPSGKKNNIVKKGQHEMGFMKIFFINKNSLNAFGEKMISVWVTYLNEYFLVNGAHLLQ